ncbi:class I SAM-dependent methyltransferase [Methylorubrum suomiense]|uniref:Ribosomal RNA small subunit methyltransferase C n=1 Tax=Methylorubrum suomiense TaxID=144191 RepID=A0ABQ4UMY2_9HYPH|nr:MULTISPECIES: class I SAM-dependent methyltransferase [Methylobacteriaceae]GJE73515.1 Ribosomal RNA small subunit methyltransferase C [Methylorubrum suomiense]
MPPAPDAIVHGLPPTELASVPDGAAQVSPLIPGSERLEDIAPDSLDRAVLLAPAGTVERRYALALALRGLKPGGQLTALAPKDKGGTRLGKELRNFGCAVAEDAKRHHRICTVMRPAAPTGLDEAIQAGRPRHVDNLALCTQPGIFSWDRLDPGTALLLRHLPTLSGKGADLGCGLGILSLAVLRSDKVASLAMIDIDRRAIDMARRNVGEARASVHWADLRGSDPTLSGLDFVVTNPPFHDGGAEDQALGKAFIGRAAAALRNGGTLYLVANAHLPYEAPLRAAFKTVTPMATEGGYKLFEARK